VPPSGNSRGSLTSSGAPGARIWVVSRWRQQQNSDPLDPINVGMMSQVAVSRLAGLALAGVAYHALAFIILHVLEPQLSPVSAIISDYAATESSWLVVTTFVAFAVVWAALALGLSWPGQAWLLVAGRVVFAVAAIGLLVAALVPAAADPRTGTVLSVALGAVRPALFVAIVVVSVGLRSDLLWHDGSWMLVILSSAALLLTLVSVAFLLEAGVAGLGQRAVFVLIYVWVSLVTIRMVTRVNSIASRAAEW